MSVTPHPRRPLALAFVAASCSLVIVYASSGTPIPLYNLYRAQDGITNADLALSSVLYLAAAATALLVLGRLSSHLGRRPLALAAIAATTTACLILATLQGVVPLLTARALQGLACGIASSAIGAYVIDAAPARPRWLAAAISGTAPMLGIPLGALASGALAQWGPAPRTLIYEIVAGVLVVCAVLTALGPETMVRRPGALASLRPVLQVPRGYGRALTAVVACSVAVWCIGGFYQAFGPSVTAERLGNADPLVAALVFVSIMVLTPFGSPLSGLFQPARALRVGMALFLAALVAIVASLYAGAILPFIVASLVVGVAQGIASTAGIRALLVDTLPEERAGLLSALYLLCYVGAATPGLIAGRLTDRFGLFEIALGYAALGTAAAILAVVAAVDRARREGT